MHLKILSLGVAALTGLALAQTGSQTMPATDRTETRSFKGMLVDANCGAPGATSSSSGTAGRSTRTDTTDTSAQRTTSSTGSGSANRSVSEWQSCPATASTTAFGLVTKEGQFLKFDSVGNTRAQLELKNRPKWTSGNKPANVKVQGVTMGDTVQVLEIK
jgi:hypothetical protein